MTIAVVWVPSRYHTDPDEAARHAGPAYRCCSCRRIWYGKDDALDCCRPTVVVTVVGDAPAASSPNLFGDPDIGRRQP